MRVIVREDYERETTDDYVCEYSLHYPHRGWCGAHAKWTRKRDRVIRGNAFLCNAHFQLLPSSVEAPPSGPLDGIPALPHRPLARWFQEALTMPATRLARIKGDWKVTLAAKVIQLTRRKGVLEELLWRQGPEWRKCINAITLAPAEGSSERSEHGNIDAV